MDIFFQIHKEKLQALAKTLFDFLRPEVEEDERLVQKGLLLYRQRQVYQLRFEGNYLLGSVQDVTPVKVVLDLDYPDVSQCSCPAEFYCRHQLAVFFAAYNEIASVEELVEKWRAPEKLLRAITQFGLKSAGEVMKEKKETEKEPTYNGWIASFTDAFTYIFERAKTKNPFYIERLFQTYMFRLRASAPKQHEWRDLYFLVASVFTFKKLLSFSKKYGFLHQAMLRQYRSCFQELVELAETSVQKLTVHSLPFSFDAFIEKLRTDTEPLLTLGVQNKEPVLTEERMILYFLLWEGLFKKSTWQMEELARLERLIEKTAAGEQHFIFSMCRLQLLFVNRRDEEVLAYMEEAPAEVIPHTLPWLERMREQKQWQRLTPYLSTLLAKSPEYIIQLDLLGSREQYAQLLAREIHAYCTAINRFDFYEKALKELLPYSFRLCKDYFFDLKDFETWSELITYRGLLVGELDREQLKTIEKKYPQGLLPIYHQSIQHHIDMKNRDNYRQAVKQLKKLRSLYRKLNKKEVWENYFRLLTEQTRRLRAFQEECRIGNLIVAE